MKRKTFATIVAVISIAIIALFFIIHIGFNFKKPSPAYTNKMVLFFSYTCPHCVTVDHFLTQYHVRDTVPYEYLEVSQSQENRSRLRTVAERCGLKQSRLGIPFLWTGSKCIVGDTPIMQYFKEQMNHAKKTR